MSFPETITLTYEEVRTKTAGQRAPLGTRGVTSDGRSFRYCKAGAAITKGYLVAAAVAATGHNYNNTSGAFTAAATTYTTTWAYIQILSSYQCDTTAETKDILEGGLLFDTYRGGVTTLKGNDGHTASSTEQTKIYFADGESLPYNITGTDYPVMLIKNLYRDVIVAPAAQAVGCVVLGVSNIAVTTALPYFWLQTWGPTAVLLYNAAVAGSRAFGSTETAGTINKYLTTDNDQCPLVGTFITASAATTYGATFIRFSP